VLFEFRDEQTGIEQRFAFNLRYYVGAAFDKNDKSNPDMRQDGVYEFAVNGTKEEQRSLKFGDINLKKSKFR
jgi:hypothetical protein